MVANKAGGATTIGGNAVATAKPDGYTLGFFPSSASIPEVYTYFYQAPYSSKDLKPVSKVAIQDIVTGKVRFAFGLFGLQDGLGLVPLVMGLFGIAEVLSNIERPEGRSVLETKIRHLLPNKFFPKSPQ